MHRSRIAAATLAVLLFATLFLVGKFVQADRSTRLVCDVWPPYTFLTDDGVSGLSVEIIQAVYGRLGMHDLEIIPLPWMRAMDMVRFGDADGLFTANYTPEREIFYHYPEEPLVESPWNVWTRKGTTIDSLDDLKGKKIGVVLGYAYTPEFWEFIQTYCTVEAVYTDKINFRKLTLGRLDATVADLGNGLALAAALKADLHPGLEIKRDGLYLAFSRKRVSEDFVRDFSEALKEFKTTGEYAAIWKKYMTPKP